MAITERKRTAGDAVVAVAAALGWTLIAGAVCAATGCAAPGWRNLIAGAPGTGLDSERGAGPTPAAVVAANENEGGAAGGGSGSAAGRDEVEALVAASLAGGGGGIDRSRDAAARPARLGDLAGWTGSGLDPNDDFAAEIPPLSVPALTPERGDDDDGPRPRIGGPTLVYSLDMVVNATLLMDPQLRAGFELINQAAGDAVTASLIPNPELEVVQTLLPLTRPFTEDRQGGPPQFDVGLTIPIDWFLFGKRAAEMRAAALGVGASEAEYADLVRRRVLEAALAYYDALEAEALEDLALRNVENFRRVERITEAAVAGGGRPVVELSRVRLDRLQAEREARDAENARVAAFADLRAVMGMGGGPEEFPEFRLAETPEDLEIPRIELPPVERSFAMAMENRPDVAAARRRLEWAEADVEVERRRAYPEVAPMIGYTRQFQERAIGFPDADSFGVGVGLTLPITDRNQGNRLRAASLAAQAGFELRATLVELRAEVERADRELRIAAANAKAVSEEQLRLAREVRDSLNKAYDAGGRPLIDVLDAQRNYRETYQLFIETRAAHGRAAAGFNATLGTRVAP